MHHTELIPDYTSQTIDYETEMDLFDLFSPLVIKYHFKYFKFYFGALSEPDREGPDERSTSEDDRICFLLKEKDSESHISCKHRLTRSKFNYNPFGLRFGKRDGRLKTNRSATRKMLPVLLFVRELKEES
ncbi:kisspeptin 2 precursor [Silurus meridionalis]|nr:kisspeptin 2 precursor [Silurus meridionalis]